MVYFTNDADSRRSFLSLRSRSHQPLRLQPGKWFLKREILALALAAFSFYRLANKLHRQIITGAIAGESLMVMCLQKQIYAIINTNIITSVIR